MYFFPGSWKPHCHRRDHVKLPQDMLMKEKKTFQGKKKPLEIQQVPLFATAGRSICWSMDLSVFTMQYPPS